MNFNEQILIENYLSRIDIWNKSHNISRERSELYHDFLVSLFTLIDDTYLGKELVSGEGDVLNHYQWCFNKTLLNFEMEKIYFNTKGDHFEYLWFFFFGAYYNSDQEEKRVRILNYFHKLFTIDVIKNDNELNAFLDLYKIFEQNLKMTH